MSPPLSLLILLIIPFLHVTHAGVTCDVRERACRAQIDAQGTNGATRAPAKSNCDYDNLQLWLIPGDADNTTCARPETIAKGVKVRIFNETITVSPNPIRLPDCFNISFEVEILDSINEVPRSFIGKNEFQLYELPDVEKLQCQNASNDGCGGYGNNCIYCDMCEQLKVIKTRPKSGTTAQEEFLGQFDDVKCPDRPGRYLVTRRVCFNDWTILDADHNCQLDILETLASSSDSAPDAETLKAAYEALQQKGYSTLVARFYLAHNSTPEQTTKRLEKEKEINAHWDTELVTRRREWNVSDAEFGPFRDWYLKFQRDTWHKEKYLPWLIYQNELACLKVTFTVCDKKPTTVTESPVSSDGPGAWWQRRSKPKSKCG